MRDAPDRQLRSFFRLGGEMVRADILRQVGLREVPNWEGILDASLRDKSPSIRKNAAFTFGIRGDYRDQEALLEQGSRERCDTVRFHMLLAARRCGASHETVSQIFERFAKRSMFGAYGCRPTGGFAGWTIEETNTVFQMLDIHCGSSRNALDTQRVQAREAIHADNDARSAVLLLGLLGHPDDVQFIESLWAPAGRRMRLMLCKTMGLHGSPLFFGHLIRALNAVDVDPGHGFALRSSAAVGLGRLGFKYAIRQLAKALESEALDFEGHPGAGLGIQRPVRADIIAALGELQCSSDVLTAYLGNTHGSAHGGFYLPTMDALWKTGDAKPLYKLLDQSDLVAANALGTIRAISGAQAVSRWKDDTREMVASVASAPSV